MRHYKGKISSKKGLQRYITRPESTTSPNKRHSAFRVGLSAHLWAITGDGVLARLVDELMKLSPNKLPEYQRGDESDGACLCWVVAFMSPPQPHQPFMEKNHNVTNEYPLFNELVSISSN
ncbi:hypothetical protein [Acaryochloris sp. 'Moss Beach']|uniref:hypothetical protein n=1 Tax=Acaryochloris sp. 'Moss Beach' TaxID=2740837 RepID=UPI001F345C88|nr:hypothetical protein [Acaryochloris sp. 'Moss Beach']